MARHRNFRKASESLHVTQPALSVTVSDLEAALGLTLFDRTSRNVTVTAHSEAFLRGAVRVVNDFDSLLDATICASHAKRGRVVVACPASIAGRFLPLLLTSCTAEHPGIEPVVLDESVERIAERHRVRFARTIAVRQLSSATGMLEAGMGVSFLPALALPHPDDPLLVSRPLPAPGLSRQIVLLSRRDRSPSPAAALVRAAAVSIASSWSDGR